KKTTIRRSRAQPHAETPSCQSFKPTTNHSAPFSQAKSDPLLSADQWLSFHDHAVSNRHEGRGSHSSLAALAPAIAAPLEVALSAAIGDNNKDALTAQCLNTNNTKMHRPPSILCSIAGTSNISQGNTIPLHSRLYAAARRDAIASINFWMKSCLALQTLGKHPLSRRHALPLSAVSNSGILCTKWQTVRSDGWADSRLHGLVFAPRKGLPAARSTVIARLAGAFVGHHRVRD
ncbi:hypothetical protein CCUS01_04981, partial [Colletotrichum cuscutae]